jgi:hypothetical protein
MSALPEVRVLLDLLAQSDSPGLADSLVVKELLDLQVVKVPRVFKVMQVQQDLRVPLDLPEVEDLSGLMDLLEARVLLDQ